MSACAAAIHKALERCGFYRKIEMCSSCNYILVMLLFSDVGDHPGNALMSLADGKTRFSPSVGGVEARLWLQALI